MNRESGARVVYFNERFWLERFPAIEIRWRRHPDEVTDEDLIRALEEVARQIATRHGG